MMHTDNHRTGSEEQQSLEESVRHQVENRHRVSGSAQRHRHIAQLGQRGIRDHTLDVVLNNPQKTHKQGSDRANHHDE